MPLCGLAMQVKPTALLPGGFLGMTLLWCAWRAGLNWRQVTGLAISWLLLALLPLGLSALSHWGRAMFEDSLFAKILPIFEKAPDAPAAIAGRVADTVRAFGLPFAIAHMLAAATCIFRNAPVL